MSAGTRKVSFRGFGSVNITSATTTVVHTGPTVLKSLIVNDVTAGAIRIYDDVACVNESLIATLGVKGSPPVGDIPYGIRCGTGLTVVTEADPDLTVTFEKF